MTSKQLNVLRYICSYQAAHGGISPSFPEMAGNGVAQGNLAKALDRLQEDGYIRRIKNRARAIEVLRPIPVPRAPDGAALYSVAL